MNRNIMTMIIVMLMLALTACGIKESNSTDMYKIGIIQYDQREILNNSSSGIIKSLENNGFINGQNCIIDVKYGEADTEQIENIATTLVKQDADLIIVVDGETFRVVSEIVKYTDIPMVFMSNVEPIEMGVLLEDGSWIENVTGIHVQLDIQEHMALIRGVLPEATSVGVLYIDGDIETEESILAYEALASQYNFTLKSRNVAQYSDLAEISAEFMKEVDSIIILDASIISNESISIAPMAKEAGVPLFGTQIEHVKYGCIAAYGVDHYEVGKLAGIMASQLITGEYTILESPFVEYSENQLCVDKDLIESLGIKLSNDIQERVTATFVSAIEIY